MDAPVIAVLVLSMLGAVAPAQDRVASPDRAYGLQLTTPQERAELRKKLRAAEAAEERHKLQRLGGGR
jgi:hypothetical protein